MREQEALDCLTWTSLAYLESVDHTVQKELLEKETSVEADDDATLDCVLLCGNSSKTFAGSLAW